jgi:DNA-binding NarL/FixJ family response regulator
MRGQPDFDFLFEPQQWRSESVPAGASGAHGSTRVLFAESNRMVAEALMLAIEIEPSLDPIGYALGGWEALELTESLSPDVIVVGPQLTGEDGFPVIRLLTELYPRVRLVVLTDTEGRDQAGEDLAAAVDYLPLNRSTDELIDAIGAASARPNRLSLVGSNAPAEAQDG